MINIIDFNEYQAIAFDLAFIDNTYNLNLCLYKLSEENDVNEVLVYRTAIFADDIKTIAIKIRQIIEIGIFDNLEYIADGKVLNEDCKLVERIDWNSFNIGGYSNIIQSDTKIIH